MLDYMVNMLLDSAQIYFQLMVAKMKFQPKLKHYTWLSVVSKH